MSELFVMAGDLCFGALALGVLANWVRRHRKKSEALFGSFAAMLIRAELVLILHPSWLSLFALVHRLGRRYNHSSDLRYRARYPGRRLNTGNGARSLPE